MGSDFGEVSVIFICPLYRVFATNRFHGISQKRLKGFCIMRGIADVVLDFLREKSIDIQHCRGESYDNASNMSGRYIGAQQRIKCVCSYADYCPCCAHSLNLVGSCAVESNTEAAGVFSLTETVHILQCIHKAVEEARGYVSET